MHPYHEHRAKEVAKAHKLTHRTGYAHGGAVSDEKQDAKMVSKGVHEHERNMHKGEKETKMELGEGGKARGHLAKRARGGAMGKKHSSTKVNVIVAPQGGGMHPPGALPVAAPARPPMAPPAAMPAAPPARPPGMGMPPAGGMGAMGGAPMMRKRGGKVPHMEAGAGGGEGRIEKMHEYGEGGFKPKKKPLHA